MESTTINKKGQFTIPAGIRKKIGLSAGDSLRLFVEEDGSLSLIPATGSLDDLYGLLHKPGRKALSLEEINEGIREAAVERVMRHARD